MPDSSKPAAPETAAPPVIAAFFAEFVANADMKYAVLEEHCDGEPKISLFDFQIEVLIYGLHCLDRAVFAFRGAEYRATFMNYGFAFACEMFSDLLPEPTRERFLERFKEHCEARQAEYGAMRPISKDSAMKNVLPYEFSKRLCFDAGVCNPPVQIVLMKWAGGIMTMMLEVAETL